MKEAYTRQLSILEGLTTGRSLIDVGAGLGIFLKVAKDRGWDAHGAETSEHAARFAASRFGIRYHSRLPAAQFDIVRISHVLEHIPDPAEFVVQLREVTKPSGILAVIMPNREPLCASMINRIRRLRSPAPKLAGAIYPDMHVLGFSPGSLAHLVVRCGFKRMSVATVSMGNRTFFPLFYDGLLTRIPLHQIRLKEFVRYYLPMLVDNVGNRFGKGQWIVAYFQAT